jgi:hypothetical protein
MIIITLILFYMTREKEDPCYGTVIRLLHSTAITAFVTETFFVISFYLYFNIV